MHFYRFKNLINLEATLADSESPIAQPVPDLSNDPLVNYSWQNFTYFAAIVLVICLVAIVGVFSRKVEHAIAAALIASLVLIGLFYIVVR